MKVKLDNRLNLIITAENESELLQLEEWVDKMKANPDKKHMFIYFEKGDFNKIPTRII